MARAIVATASTRNSCADRGYCTLNDSMDFHFLTEEKRLDIVRRDSYGTFKGPENRGCASKFDRQKEIVFEIRVEVSFQSVDDGE